MSTKKTKLIKSIKTINLNHKYPAKFGNLSTNSNETIIIKTNNNYNSSSILNIKSKNSLIVSHSKTRLQSAQISNKINKISRSTLATEKKTINKFYNYFEYNNIILNNDNKENKQNQVNLFFNNSFLNNCYNNKRAKVNDYYVKLNEFYNPNHNYYRIVKDEKNIIKELISQTKNNFNNNYKLIYVNPDSIKRNNILRFFNSIRENKTKNIDKRNSIEFIAIKEFDKYFNSNTIKNENKVISLNKHIIFPSSFNMNTFVNKNEKIKLKTVKITDEISKQNFKTIETKTNVYNSALYPNRILKKINGEFFKTLPKKNKYDNNDIYLDCSKTSSIGS